MLDPIATAGVIGDFGVEYFLPLDQVTLRIGGRHSTAVAFSLRTFVLGSNLAAGKIEPRGKKKKRHAFSENLPS